ncbi:MAG TPA: hypothetical protein VIY69_16510 [Candidatus Acidoferrales bacterium]
MQTEISTEELVEIPWTMEEPFAAMAFGRGAGRLASSVRSVGFIARPDAVRELMTCIEGRMMKLLQKVPGFSGAIVLHSHKESRSVSVLSFWKTETQAIHTSWETFSAVCDLIYPLVDACTKVQTFHGAFVDGQRAEAKQTRNS